MRLVSRLAPPAAIVALALTITAAPASAELRDACSDARKQVAKSINELDFYSALSDSPFPLHSLAVW